MKRSDFEESGSYYDLRLEIEEMISQWGYVALLDAEDGWGIKVFREHASSVLPLGKIYFTLAGLEYNFDSRESRQEVCLIERLPFFERLRCAEELMLGFELLDISREGMEYEAEVLILGEKITLKLGKIPRTDYLSLVEIGEDSEGVFVEIKGEKFSEVVNRRIYVKTS